MGIIHKTSIVAENAQIGENTRIWQFCNIMGEVYIGNDCNIGQGCFVENGVSIGNNVTIKNNVALYQGVICEDDVFLGPNCVFTNVRYPRSFVSRKDVFEKTHICKGATIGANATIVCGITIGSYAMIGAGSVVVENVDNHALMVGNPARKIGYVCMCGEKLIIDKSKKLMLCAKCSRQYKLEQGRCIEVGE